MLKVVLIVFFAMWLIGAIGSFIDNAMWRVGLITYPEVWVLIVLVSLFAWPIYLWLTYVRRWPDESPPRT